jgi:hypothetical protein
VYGEEENFGTFMKEGYNFGILIDLKDYNIFIPA